MAAHAEGRDGPVCHTVSEMHEQLAGIVGSEHVAADVTSLDSYGRDGSFAHPLSPWLVVRPADEDQVRRVVVWANKTGAPLVPVSSGPPRANGDTVPSVPGAVIVDTSRLDHVLRVDRRNRMAVIEPGVTWSRLQAELATYGMRVTPPLRPRANKSVVTSLLEREPTLIPRYNFHLPEPLRGCGVVWGTGQTMFTGEAGSGPRSLEEQWDRGLVQADPKGPASTDFFRLLTGAQGSMGIVTWASVKCELTPSVHKLRFVSAASLADLVPLVYRLTRVRLGDELLVLDGVCFERLLASAGLSVTPGHLPPWTLILGLGGREHRAAARVEVAEKDVRDLAEHHGLALRSALNGVPTGAVVDLLRECSETPWRLAARGGSADVFFLTTLDRAQGHVELVDDVAASLGMARPDVGVYLQPQHQGVSYHVEFSVAFDPTDDADARRAHEFHQMAAERLMGAGAFFSRPYGSWARPVYNRDAASREALRKVKRIFDPNGVLNPGKLCF